MVSLTNQVNNQSIIPSTDVTQLTLTLKMTTAQVVETSVIVNNNSPIQDYVYPDDQTQPFGFILVHEYIHSHSTTTLSFNIIHKFTFNDIFLSSYEYIYLQLQHIFIHIQGQNFYSTLLLYSFNSLLMC